MTPSTPLERLNEFPASMGSSPLAGLQESAPNSRANLSLPSSKSMANTLQP